MIGTRKLRREQIESVFQLIGPMGEVIEKMHQVILAHHPAGVPADDCPVCSTFAGELQPILDRWADVRSKVLEHWDI
jgi:hypothetical protein